MSHRFEEDAMQNLQKKRKGLGLLAAAFPVWFIMNIRVEAGIGSTFERAVDGLVGLVLLLAAVYGALEFFALKGNETTSHEQTG